MSNEPDHITYQNTRSFRFLCLLLLGHYCAEIVYNFCVKCENVGYKYGCLTSVVVISDHGNIHAMYWLRGKLRWPQSWAVVLCVFFFTYN